MGFYRDALARTETREGETVFKSIKQATAAIGGLSNPDKMPCYGWSIPAKQCGIGSKLRKVEGSACSICYALKGTYVFPCVKTALDRRFEILQDALSDPAKRFEFIEAFTYILNTRRASWRPGRRNDSRYFRWHDAGDIQNVDHLAIVAEIASQTPDVLHWLPTRELPIINAYIREYGPLPANLRVRASAAMIGSKAPNPAGVGAGSAIHPKGTLPPIGTLECGAYRNEGHCGDCRACWTDPQAVSYGAH